MFYYNNQPRPASLNLEKEQENWKSNFLEFFLQSLQMLSHGFLCIEKLEKLLAIYFIYISLWFYLPFVERFCRRYNNDDEIDDHNGHHDKEKSKRKIKFNSLDVKYECSVVVSIEHWWKFHEICAYKIEQKNSTKNMTGSRNSKLHK